MKRLASSVQILATFNDLVINSMMMTTVNGTTSQQKILPDHSLILSRKLDILTKKSATIFYSPLFNDLFSAKY